MKGFKIVQKNLEQRGYTVKCFNSKEDAVVYLNEKIDKTSVAFGGSATLQEMNLYPALSTHNEIHWHWENGPTELISAAQTDVYITSANGLAETGEIINIDGIGNRTASTLYGHKEIYFIMGKNKLAPTYEQALWRARNIAAPKNAQRLKVKTPCAVKGDHCYDCKSPNRICRGLVTMWGPMMKTKTEVILIDENLGY